MVHLNGKNLTSEQASKIIANAKNKEEGKSEKTEKSQEKKEVQKSKDDFKIENYKTIEKELNDIGGLFKDVNLHSINTLENGMKYIRFTSEAQAPESVMKKELDTLDDKYFSKYGLKIENSKKFKPDILYSDGRYQFDLVLKEK